LFNNNLLGTGRTSVFLRTQIVNKAYPTTVTKLQFIRMTAKLVYNCQTKNENASITWVNESCNCRPNA